jgi:ATP-dependent 26S proteasome regulatory subunit
MADPEREKALEDYKNKLLESREWEAKLKALRLEIKGLQRDFDVSEENIKALQSVGQIIGEVLKQLDEERCKISHRCHQHCGIMVLTRRYSHREGLIRSSLRRRLPVQGGEGEAEARNSCRSRHDHPHHHAHAASRS